MWWGFFGADHGIGWLLQTRASEISFGDTLFSPFVACGQFQQQQKHRNPTGIPMTSGD